MTVIKKEDYGDKYKDTSLASSFKNHFSYELIKECLAHL